MTESAQNVLEEFLDEHRALRSRLAIPGREADDPAMPSPEVTAALRREVDELGRQLLHHSRLEGEVLEAMKSQSDSPTQGLPEAGARCEAARQLLERLDALSYIADDAAFNALYKFFARSLQSYLDEIEASLIPAACDSLEGGELSWRVQVDAEEHAESMPAATRAADGRLDIGTGEDRSPAL
ncbi:MAG TPA: hemerythrin domain-containing protein [Aromatoleum sp.]|uniref:hemerythrin domain-containing protein n=1 Tax=Aromatoleum sp. TaxID=2307007 RepID=UPI002B4A9C74|nr:hemerythrin domain-containing protein [Aromatoleum sp.]HJV24681.1 hemerythrin domain-containing protein [Aromatoleum sp.]